MRASLAYWQEKLAGVKPLELPTDKPRPRMTTSHGRTIHAQLRPGLDETLQRLSRTLQVTPFAVMFAAYNVLLHRYARVTDIAVGVPIATRPHPALEQLIGSFLNVLVHRNDLSAASTFEELVAIVQDTALDASAHQAVPFERVVEVLDLPRDTSRLPLVQVLFNVANAPVPSDLLPGIQAEMLMLDRTAAQFELSLHVHGNAVFLEYNTDLFEDGTAERLLDEYCQLLEQVATNPQLPLAALRVASDTDRAQLAQWNATERAYRTDVTLVDLLVEQAERTPDAIAVSAPDGAYTYVQLLRRAQAIALELRGLGVAEGDRVAVVLPRGRDLPAALLGVLGSGAAYVPLDPHHPVSRLEYALTDSGASAVVTAAGMPRFNLPMLDVGACGDATEAFCRTFPSATAYVIYTSGSTGRPKGVAVSHGALMNFLYSMAEEPGISPSDAVL